MPMLMVFAGALSFGIVMLAVRELDASRRAQTTAPIVHVHVQSVPPSAYPASPVTSGRRPISVLPAPVDLAARRLLPPPPAVPTVAATRALPLPPRGALVDVEA